MRLSSSCRSWAQSLGRPPHRATAGGLYYVITVKTWFDERTISRRRGDMALWPNPRQVVLFDASGRSYLPSREGERALEDRKSTRLNSSHLVISYAVFCLKKKKKDYLSLLVNP